MRMRALGLGLWAAVALLACGDSGNAGNGTRSEPRRAKPAACTAFGQRCEVAPGKFGTCVQQDECADPKGCFICQSQH